MSRDEDFIRLLQDFIFSVRILGVLCYEWYGEAAENHEILQTLILSVGVATMVIFGVVYPCGFRGSDMLENNR